MPARRVRTRAFSSPKTKLVVADILAIAVALVAAFGAADVTGKSQDANAWRGYIALSLLSLPVWPMAFAHRRLYNARFVTRHAEEFRRILGGVGAGVAGLIIEAYMFRVYVSREWLVLVFVIGSITVAAEREVARIVFERVRRKGGLLRPVVIVGTNLEALELNRMFENDRALGYQVVGFVDDDPAGPPMICGVPVLGTIDQTPAIVQATGATGVVIAATAMDLGSSNRLIRTLTDSGVHVELSSTLRDIAAHRLTVRPLGRFPVVYVEPVQRSGWRPVAKRTFDVVLSTTLLVLALPVMILSAILIKLTSPGPVFFRQERVGADGDRFKVIKFRTMVRDAEARLDSLRDLNEVDGALFKMKDDPRVTKVGRFLRKWSIDELPQLWNVLRNEMSLVGPRPALPSEVELWGADLHQRLRVKPGITGMWQVNGRSSASFEDYERLDLYYVDNWSLVSDLMILMKTVPSVLFARGAC